jgi:hypothetical protein
MFPAMSAAAVSGFRWKAPASAEQPRSGAVSVVGRRATFWILVTIFVASPVCLQIIAYRSRSNPVEHAFLFTTLTEAAFVLIALWSIIFVRCEPTLVRIAPFLMIVICYANLWVHKL